MEKPFNFNQSRCNRPRRCLHLLRALCACALMMSGCGQSNTADVTNVATDPAMAEAVGQNAVAAEQSNAQAKAEADARGKAALQNQQNAAQ